MSKHKENSHQKIDRWDEAGYTEIWEKDSAGATNKEVYRRHYHDSGRIVDYWGNEVGKTTSDDSSGGCFLTTACVAGKGLTDQCHELQVLREFRDSYVSALGEGPGAIDRYYRVSPRICTEIARQSNAKEILERLYQDLVLTCVNLIEGGMMREAFQHYRSNVLQLEKTYLVEKSD